MINKTQILATQALVRKYFKNAEGNPYEMSPGECEKWNERNGPAVLGSYLPSESTNCRW